MRENFFLSVIPLDVPAEGEPEYFEALRQGRYDVALPLIRSAIDRRDGIAMGALGAMLFLGLGIAQDENAAVGWFEQGSDRGDPFCQTAYGICLATGRGRPQDEFEAAHWLYRAGVSGQTFAIRALDRLALKNAKVVGKHFSEEQFRRLLRTLRTRPGNQASC